MYENEKGKKNKDTDDINNNADRHVYASRLELTGKLYVPERRGGKTRIKETRKKRLIF